MREESKLDKILFIIGICCLITIMVLVFSRLPKPAHEDCVARTTIEYRGGR